MSHMMNAIPENSESIPAAADDFCNWLANESAGHTVTVGDMNTIGHLVIARGVTREEIAEYVSETGDAFVSDGVRSGVRPGHIAVVTDSQGFVYGYMLADDAAAEATLSAAERIEAEFEEAVEAEPANAPRTVLPGLDIRNGHTVGTISVALNGMIPGNEGDMITGAASGDYVHVTRTADGFNAVHVATARRFETTDVGALSNWIHDRIAL